MVSYSHHVDAPGEQVVRLLHDYSAEAELLVHACAEHHDLHPTDLHAAIAVMFAEAAGSPLTPGRLGARLGISSGATTAVLDRLTRADLVERVPDERDRRRTTLRVGTAADGLGASFLGPLGIRLDGLLAGFTATEFATVVRFLENVTKEVRAQRREISPR
jgi:DNA-binding MarR family transcriptional regulator